VLAWIQLTFWKSYRTEAAAKYDAPSLGASIPAP